MACGRLGWTPREFYLSDPDEFFYACRGYFIKLQDDSLAIRNLATIIYRVNGGKQSMDNIWPLTVDKDKSDKITVDREMWDEIKRKHKLK